MFFVSDKSEKVLIKIFLKQKKLLKIFREIVW